MSIEWNISRAMQIFVSHFDRPLPSMPSPAVQWLCVGTHLMDFISGNYFETEIDVDGNSYLSTCNSFFLEEK
jgi:hypothetical protein